MRRIYAVAGCRLAISILCAMTGLGLLAQTAEVAVAPQVRIVEAVDEARLATLKGNVPPMARAKYDVGRVDGELPMGDLVLVLRRGAVEQRAFDALVAAEYDPASAEYHRWLTAAEIGERFGPAQSDVDAIENWLRGHGFRIDEVMADRLSIRFSGVAGQVQEAFHTEVHSLRVPVKSRITSGVKAGAVESFETHFANMTDPQIPMALVPVVVGVKALHDFFPKPLHRMGAQVRLNSGSGSWERIGPTGSSLNTANGAVTRIGQDVNSSQDARQLQGAKQSQRAKAAGEERARPEFGTSDGYGDVLEDISPYDFAAIYDVTPLWKAVPAIDGTGQKIAIAGRSNINPADVATFRSVFGLPVKAPTVVITNSDPGNCANADDSCFGDLVENTLDVEWAGAVAKGASVILVTSSASTPTTDALYLSENYIIQNKTAPVMNVSYGSCELLLGTAGNTEFNNLWQTAYAEGIAVFVASGDSGSPSCDQGEDQVDGVPYAAQFGLSVNGLASTPYNTAVGGTDLNWGSTASPYWAATSNAATKASALGYVPEVPWNQTCANPLTLPILESDANYLGVTGVTDTETACNFVYENWEYIEQNYGQDLSGLVDTVGGGGGVSNCTTSNEGYVSSCGGGYAKPVWQAGVTGIPADSKRDLPDMSFFASDGFLGSAYLMCVSAGGNACTYSATAEPTAQEVGGTSVASPAMAGVMALINQNAGSAQGNPNTQLYGLAAKQTYANCSAGTVTASSGCLFNDVNTGTNGMPCVSGAPNCSAIHSGDPIGILSGYSGTVGYDLATGLGSLNVANVVNNWPTATSGPVVSLAPASLTFAAATEGVASAVQAITLSNTGKGDLTLSGTGLGIRVTGTDASSFTETNTCGTSVAAGGSCVISVTFKPAAAGSLTAEISVADNAYGSPQTVSLSGTGVAPAPVAKLSADSLTFGSTVVGATNTAPAITLSNSGTAALSLSRIAITGTNASSFTETNSCGSSVAAGANCSITLSFKPITSGSLTASLTVTDNAAGSPQTLALAGTATPGAGPVITVSPASLSFASTAVGVTTAAQVVTVKNTGKGAATLTSIGVTGTNASSFLKSATTCGSSLSAGASCTVSVEFKPAVAGALSASLSVADNASGSPQLVTLKGTGVAGKPVITVSPASLSFATTLEGSTTAVQIVTVKNTGTGVATLTSKTVTGTNATSFLRSATTCGGTLAAGASCTVSITFKPLVTGALTASLTVVDNAAGSPHVVALKGTGYTPSRIAATPTLLNFSTTVVGSATPAQVVTLKNSGSLAATLTSIVFAGTNPGSFLVTAKTCTASLPGLSSCTISLEFKPVGTGPQSATYTISSNAAGSPQVITLRGTGYTPARIAATPTLLNFAATAVGGTTAAQVVTVKNLGSKTATLTSEVLGGTNAGSFVVSAKSCGSTLNGTSSCTISLEFKPVAAGALSATYTIVSDAAGSPQVITLRGAGK